MSGFRGFADFAKPDFASASGSTTAAATLAAARAAKSKKSTSAASNKPSDLVGGKSKGKAKNSDGTANNNNNSLRPSPIYTGSDQRLIVLFRKIGQKRDPITKVRALEELTSVVYGNITITIESSSTATSTSYDNNTKSENDEPPFARPEKIAALSHLIYLHETKLGYDNNSSVRAGSYRALLAARRHVPKAWSSLLLGDNADAKSGDDDADAGMAVVNTVGMAWGASKGDPAAEVARNAAAFLEALISVENNENDKGTTPKPGKASRRAICQYSKTILGCKRPSSLQDVINPTSSSSSSAGGPGGVNAGGKGGKKKQKNKANGAAEASSSAAAAASSIISESEREEMEERYERVILSVLCGLGWLLESCPENNNNDDDAKSSVSYAGMAYFPEAQSITRLFTSSRGSFRRGAYVCIGKMCQFAPSLIGLAHDSNSTSETNNVISLGSLVPSLLTSEKDPSNFASLFEMILSYLAAFRSTGNADPFAVWQSMDPVAFTKSLSKALRRGCCGAPAAVWGPIILPIVASLPAHAHDNDGGKQEEKEEKQPLPLSVVLSLWEGRKSTAGTTDTIAIVSAVTECVTFLMLRRPKKNSSRYPVFTDQSWRSCGQLFLETLSYYLTEAPENVGYSPVAPAVDELCATLSRDLHKLDVASSSVAENDGCDDRGIAVIKSWFWGEEGLHHTLSLEKNSEESIVRKWDTLLAKLPSPSSNLSASHLIPSCKKLFHSIVGVVSTDRRNKTCSADEGSLLLSIIHYCGVDAIFPIVIKGEEGEECSSMSIERFCINDLLRWILVHASSMATASAANNDFEIFKLCLEALPSAARQKEIWETVLRELIKSHCDYTTMAAGLTVLAGVKNIEKSDNSTTADLVRCEVLDAFAVDSADQAMCVFRRSHDILRHHEELDEADSSPAVKRRRGNLSLFLKTCVGISKDFPPGDCALVSVSVVRNWINLCCKRNPRGHTLEDNLILENDLGANVLLTTLLDLVSSPSKRNMISDDEAVKLIYESWLEGGKTWSDRTVKFFDSTNDSLKEQVISMASSALCNDIHSEPPADHALLELICQSWAKRASRLTDIFPGSSLDSLGLGNIELWKNAVLSEGEIESEFLFLSLMYLLHSNDSDEHRKELLLDGSGTELFVHIQTCLSKRDGALLQSFQSRTVRNRQLIETLGGRDGLTETLLKDCCMRNIDLLSSLMKDEINGDEKLIHQALTSLSFLMSLLFPSAWRNKDTKEKEKEDDVIAADVKEGDSLWYEKGEKCERVKVTVVKIHRDDFPNLYFSIKEEASNGERQTVASRLKRNPKSTGMCETPPPDEGNPTQREHIGRCIVDKLIKPFLSELPFDDDSTRVRNEASAECTNIVISQCGLVSMGIGSVRYDIFQAVSSLERSLCDALSTSERSLGRCIPLLRCLSSAMGYGVYTIPSKDNASVLKMDPTGSVLKLLELYDDVSWVEEQKADPMESFHSSVLVWLAAAASSMKDGETFRRVSATMHSLSDILLLPGSHDLAINSLQVMNAVSSLQAVSNHCMDYSSLDNEDEKSVLSKLTDCFVNLRLCDSGGFWMEAFTALVHKNNRAMLLPAANTFSDELCDCLFDPVKRWCAFQLLQLFAKDPQPLQSGDDATIPSEIEQTLSVWKDTLEEEEAIELEEDVLVAASWLPERIMSLLQRIGSEPTSTSHPQPGLMGNVLAWILSLDILDVAGSVDMRNRSHISSFIQKTNSLGFIMNLILHEADLDIGRNENVFACTELSGNDIFLSQKVATLAAFRTVESLPTLVKTWYNDDCPRFLRQTLSAFVESIVAPATLQRELVRIKDATSFGEMTVSGSCVSREVIATYEQDECQLSVMIRMPSTFPLRNVEVDCQKTMGISEKRWRRWALQIMLMVNNQDGSVLDALQLWKQNVDKEFDGVEPCPVCYSVLCIKTHQMPNLECKTCHNRFHTSCLYKWFQSSGKSQCVICQQPWSGTKV